MLVKDAHRLSLTKLIFEKTGGPQVHYPPTFYFADPIDRLPTTTEYAEIADVHHLISNCIVYYEQYADKLSWSTLEGSMSTIRGEKTLTGHYKARYLLLPNVARSANDKMIGSDLDHIVGNLTFVEYTIGLEALDIFNRVRDIESKRTVDSDTINTMDYISRKLASIVSSSPGETLKSGAEEFAELQLLLGRVQYAFEKMQGEAVLLEQQYVFLINRTNEYLRETMIMAPVPEQPDLSAALVDAYPYHYLRNPMSYLPVYTTQLANSIERLGALVTLLSTATSNDELKQRERQSRAISVFGVLIAIAALLFALPAFFPEVNAHSILKLIGFEAIYTSNTGIVALVMLALALLGFLLWFCVWNLRRIRVYSRPKKNATFFVSACLSFGIWLIT